MHNETCNRLSLQWKWCCIVMQSRLELTCNCSSTKCLSPTNKFRHSPPLSAYSITTVTAGSHFKSGVSQWSEPWLSCDDSGSGRSIHSLLNVATILLATKTNLIFSNISFRWGIAWWVPFQCNRRSMCVYSCFQVLNWIRSESCRNINAIHNYNVSKVWVRYI